jgi:ribonuclease HII
MASEECTITHGSRTIRPDLKLERALLAGGVLQVAGIDEAGRGALAGPVVAAAVVLPVDRPDLPDRLAEVRDSKLMTPHQREINFARIMACSDSAATGLASHEEIDQLGLISATRLAMMRAVDQLGQVPAHLVLDYMILPECELPQTSLAHGDATTLSIAAASVLAKVTRDRMMIELDRRFPGYGFARHKGYGTRDHRLALAAFGPCDVHRRSYAPVAASLEAVHPGGWR